MNCNQFKKEYLELLDNDDIRLNKELKDHLNNCEACRDEYNDTIETISLLKPRVQVSANPDMKNAIINQLKEKNKMKNNKRSISVNLKRAISIAAMIVIVLAIIPLSTNTNMFISSARAAEKVFENSLDALSEINSLFIKFKVRTIEHDNFELIDVNADFVEHTIIKDFSKPEKWKIEKTKRIVSCDGINQYLYVKDLEYALKESLDVNFVSWMKRLLNPQELLEQELENAKNCKTCSYNVDRNEGVTTLTIQASAQGDFKNSYMKNSSIIESDSKIIYTFSGENNLLKGLQVFVEEGGKEILILEVESIQYDKKFKNSDFEINLPEDVSWMSADKVIKNEKFTNISSEKAARQFLEACSNEKWSEIEDVFDLLKNLNAERTSQLKEYLGGMQIVSIGEPFKSGKYPGEFVPYTIKLKDGKIHEHNLSLRNDNKNKVWIIDGGI